MKQKKSKNRTNEQTKDKYKFPFTQTIHFFISYIFLVSAPICF